jgi:methylated-DNA-[protein]-cysteine S-methyltransferase
MPSPIGGLGIELLGTLVTRLIIEPAEPQRSDFTPLHRIGGSDLLDEVFGRLSEYFAGVRRKLELTYDLGPCRLDGFSRRVLRETARIPYGKTRTYQGLADSMGRPEACHQVLAVLTGNPLPILIPCHRVIAGLSGLGVYVAGADRKTWLLELEARVSDPL